MIAIYIGIMNLLVFCFLSSTPGGTLAAVEQSADNSYRYDKIPIVTVPTAANTAVQNGIISGCTPYKIDLQKAEQFDKANAVVLPPPLPADRSALPVVEPSGPYSQYFKSDFERLPRMKDGTLVHCSELDVQFQNNILKNWGRRLSDDNGIVERKCTAMFLNGQVRFHIDPLANGLRSHGKSKEVSEGLQIECPLIPPAGDGKNIICNIQKVIRVELLKKIPENMDLINLRKEFLIGKKSEEAIGEVAGSTYSDPECSQDGIVAFYMKKFNSSLENLANENTPGSCLKKIEALKNVVKQLIKLHKKNIYHLDIKPGNILVDEDLHARLIDFGESSEKKWIDWKNYAVDLHIRDLISINLLLSGIREDKYSPIFTVNSRTADKYSLVMTLSQVLFGLNSPSQGGGKDSLVPGSKDELKLGYNQNNKFSIMQSNLFEIIKNRGSLEPRGVWRQTIKTIMDTCPKDSTDIVDMLICPLIRPATRGKHDLNKIFKFLDAQKKEICTYMNEKGYL
ncbi:MAG: hypothetical protein HQK53_00295 [Oligoflexia bacterium]|nr:hypothetical protein [Oligoflexia bacterium]